MEYVVTKNVDYKHYIQHIWENNMMLEIFFLETYEIVLILFAKLSFKRIFFEIICPSLEKQDRLLKQQVPAIINKILCNSWRAEVAWFELCFEFHFDLTIFESTSFSFA